MNEFMNWTNTGIVITHNWYWLALAFVIGCWVGYRTTNWSTKA